MGVLVEERLGTTLEVAHVPGNIGGSVLINHDAGLEKAPCWARGEFGEHGGVWVKCAKGHLGRLHLEHKDHKDGAVKPSRSEAEPRVFKLVCPNEDCSWHVHAVLDKWGEE